MKIELLANDLIVELLRVDTVIVMVNTFQTWR